MSLAKNASRGRIFRVTWVMMCMGMVVACGACRPKSKVRDEPEAKPFPRPQPVSRAPSRANPSQPATRVKWSYEGVGAIGVNPFGTEIPEADSAADQVASLLEQAFTNSGRFKVVTRRDLMQVMGERDLQLVLSSDEQAEAAQAYKVAGVDVLVAGRIRSFELAPHAGGDVAAGTMSGEVRLLRVSDGGVEYAYSTKVYRAADHRVGGRMPEPAVVLDRLARQVAEDLVRNLVPARGDLGQAAIAFERASADGEWQACTGFTTNDAQGRIVLRNLPMAMEGQLFQLTVARSGRVDDLMVEEIAGPQGATGVTHVDFSPAELSNKAGAGMYIVTLTEGSRPVVVQPFRIERVTLR